MAPFFVHLIILPNINLQNFFTVKIRSQFVIKLLDLITPQVCRYTTL